MASDKKFEHQILMTVKDYPPDRFGKRSAIIVERWTVDGVPAKPKWGKREWYEQGGQERNKAVFMTKEEGQIIADNWAKMYAVIDNPPAYVPPVKSAEDIAAEQLAANEPQF